MLRNPVVMVPRDGQNSDMRHRWLLRVTTRYLAAVAGPQRHILTRGASNKLTAVMWPHGASAASPHPRGARAWQHVRLESPGSAPHPPMGDHRRGLAGWVCACRAWLPAREGEAFRRRSPAIARPAFNSSWRREIQTRERAASPVRSAFALRSHCAARKTMP